MSATAVRPEKFIAAKMLSHELREQWGYDFSEIACRNLMHAMAIAGHETVRGCSVRASDARKFILANPNWRPFSKKEMRLVFCRDEQAN